eukprot:TRINITY_DN28142_c0_g1_i1.p1 TRINITY_DN28142_c0_g1~~TRINITY_DN28142_c0_g1_i1.p1  ORF type:complete len:416 (-),score=84.73 TRINITY_DN28142_c0_g1_i1:355-1602(-)
MSRQGIISDSILLNNDTISVHTTQKSEDPCHRPRDGVEVHVELHAATIEGAEKLADRSACSTLSFILGEEDAEECLVRAFTDVLQMQASARAIGLVDATSFSSTIQSVLKSMGKGACVLLSSSSQTPPAQGGGMVDNQEGKHGVRVQLVNLEPGKWDLDSATRVSLAAKKRALGNRHFQAGRIDVAVKRYRDALDLVEFDEDFESDPEDEAEAAPPSSKQEGPEKPSLEEVQAERGRCLANLAAAALKKEDFANARRYCERAVHVSANNAKVWFRKGKAEMGLHELTSAERSFAEALRLSPDDREAQRALREVRMARREEKTAKSERERAMFGCAKDRPARESSSAVEALWKGGADAVAGQHDRPKPQDRVYASEEERAAEIEYNKRQLMYHMEKNRVQAKVDSEEETVEAGLTD